MWKILFFTRAGETDSPKSTSQHPPDADSLPGRGSSLSPCPSPAAGFPYLFKTPARRSVASAGRSDAVCTSPLGASEGLWGDGKAALRGCFQPLFPKLHQRACFLLAFSPPFLPFLAFPCSPPSPFPCFFCCFAFPPLFLALLFFCLFCLFFFFNSVEACKQPGLLSQLGIRGEKRPFWAQRLVFFPQFVGVWGHIAAKGKHHLGK